MYNKRMKKCKQTAKQNKHNLVNQYLIVKSHKSGSTYIIGT